MVEWPGQHERWWSPTTGPPQGAIDLTAGTHTLDYYNAYVATPEGNPPVTACLAVKGGAFADWTMLDGGSKAFFRPIGKATIDAYTLQKGRPRQRHLGGSRRLSP